MNIFLLIWSLVALLVPNVWLNCVEPYGLWSQIANILLPAGVYLLVLSAWKRIGITVVVLFPLMVMCAFQIVLLYLYGDGIIAVDMFLNVVTTNAGEIAELLGNLLISIGIVVALYVPALVMAVIAWKRGIFLGPRQRRDARYIGLVLAVGGLISVGIAMRSASYRFMVDTFPVNVCSNLREAFHRWDMVTHYPETSASYAYDARSLRADTIPETYIMVIGETGRAANWQLEGYERATNPRLSQLDGLTYFTRSLSESNTTHKSVPMMLSTLTATTFTDSITAVKSILTAFREAGYHTAFISNQMPNRSFTELMSHEADTTLYIESSGLGHAYDHEMLQSLCQILGGSEAKKQFVVLHTYGSHFLYRDRYPQSQAHFLPDNATDAGASNRRQLVNAYDNSVVYTDSIIAQAIAIAQERPGLSAVVYSADHGEDIYDDERQRFLHASPKPTYYQLHVPTLVWLSPQLQQAQPQLLPALRANADACISPQRTLFHTMLQLADLQSPRFDRHASLADTLYHPAPARYLNDLNEALPVPASGISQHHDLPLLTPYLP